MEKQIVEVKLPEDADIFLEIVKLVQQSAWVWISNALHSRLCKQYPNNHPSRNPFLDRHVFEIRPEPNGLKLFLFHEYHTWNKVECIIGLLDKDNRSSDVHIAWDPSILVFLS